MSAPMGPLDVEAPGAPSAPYARFSQAHVHSQCGAYDLQVAGLSYKVSTAPCP